MLEALSSSSFYKKVFNELDKALLRTSQQGIFIENILCKNRQRNSKAEIAIQIKFKILFLVAFTITETCIQIAFFFSTTTFMSAQIYTM